MLQHLEEKIESMFGGTHKYQFLRTAEGQQVGALRQRAALPPMLAYGLSPDERFQQALHLGQCPLPTEQPAVLDLDLSFAPKKCPQPTKAIGAVKELHRRWQKRLRQFQHPALRATTAKRDLGFVGLMVILTSWPDISYPHGLIHGLPAVGYAPGYGIFPSQPAARITFQQVIDDCDAHNVRILASLKPGKDDGFLLEQAVSERC